MTEERRQVLSHARWLVEIHGGNFTKASAVSGIARKTLSDRYATAIKHDIPAKAHQSAASEKLSIDESDNRISLAYLGDKISTPEELIKSAKIDMSVWEVDRVVVNQWEVAGKKSRGQDANGKWQGDDLWKTPLRQISVTLRKKQDIQVALEKLLDDIRNARSVPVKKRQVPSSKKRRLVLEIAIMDPHMGLECYTPEADQVWNLDLCEQFYLFAVEDLIEQAKVIGDIEKILWVFGNDFNHTDTLEHTTTRGTNQPEAVSHHTALYRGEKLALAAAELMLRHAPVHAVQIPGNHDRLSSYMMGRVLNAFFHANENFTVDAEMNPFKKFRFGASLLGMEHGHSISPIRFAALMANEWRWDWAETHYHEWHCGDQHRKGSSKPSVFEEQGVSVEFLASIVAPNQWHRMKSFNFQKRAANGFLWDYDCGQINRLTTNISKYTGRWMGDSYDRWLERNRPSGS